VHDTVLVVDDDANARIIAETLLRVRGLHVRSTGDPAEAPALIDDPDVAVVVLDLGASALNGVDMLHRLRNHPETSAHVIAITDRTEPEVERFAERMGADAFLRKPLQPAAFINLVEQLLGTPVARTNARSQSPKRP